MGKLDEFKQLYKNQRGLTLVELLAVLVLLSLVLVLVSSIHLMGANQYKDQSQAIKRQENVRLVMTVITKDIRRSTSITVPDQNHLKLEINGQPVIYSSGLNEVEKGTTTIFQNAVFTVKPMGNGVELTVEDPKYSSKYSLTSTLYIKQ